MTLTGDLAAAKQSGKFLTPCAQSLMNNMDDQYAFTLYALSTPTLSHHGYERRECAHGAEGGDGDDSGEGGPEGTRRPQGQVTGGENVCHAGAAAGVSLRGGAGDT